MSKISSLRFLTALIGVKADAVANSGLKIYAEVDPDGIAAAEIKVNEDAVARSRDRRVAAERALQEDLEETSLALEKVTSIKAKLKQAMDLVEGGSLSDEKKAKVMDEARGLAAELKAAEAHYQKELQDDVQKRSILDRFIEAHGNAVAALDAKKDILARAKERMQVAIADREAAEQEAAINNELASLNSSSSTALNMALAAMNDVTREAEDEARALAISMEEGKRTGGATSTIDELVATEAAKASQSDDVFAAVR